MFRKGRGGIFFDAESRRGLSPIAVVEMLAERYPAFFKPWQNRVRELSMNDISSVPDGRMSAAARKFAFRFVCISRELILKLS